MEQEIWKPIKGYEGLYEVSNLGRVKSLERFIKSGNKYGLHKYGGKILKAGVYRGYLGVSLCKNKTIKQYYVHRLVANSFIQNIENKLEVDHINTNRSDNRVENLRWVTKKENANNPISLVNKRNNHKNGADKLIGKLNKKSIPIVAVSTNGDEILFFDCMKDAFRNGFSLAHVWECVYKRRKSHKGYKWFLKSEYNNLKFL